MNVRITWTHPHLFDVSTITMIPTYDIQYACICILDRMPDAYKNKDITATRCIYKVLF
jgi:hypothetical protein